MCGPFILVSPTVREFYTFLSDFRLYASFSQAAGIISEYRQYRQYRGLTLFLLPSPKKNNFSWGGINYKKYPFIYPSIS